MKQKLSNVWQWLITSSANPEAVSLTAKGFLMGIIPVIMTFSGIAHLSITSDVLSNVFTLVANLIDVTLTVVSGIWMIYGLMRKIVFTLENK